ncbi:MAG: FAD-dependent oxidoreductase [Fimbriimonadaceae bacterium]|jgi:D-amino-acid dehydrogenase|nr:FAD-dependent oxidoreductase [Fimbriimonadaceae bacterium]
MSSSKVLVLGGGIVGLSCAYELALAGFSVTVVDRNQPSHDQCSNGNAGMIVPSHFVPLASPGMVRLGLKMMGNPSSPFGFAKPLTFDLIKWSWQFAKAGTKRHVARNAPLLLALNLASRSKYQEWASRLGTFSVKTGGLLMVCETPKALHHEEEGAAEARKLGLATETLTPDQVVELDSAIKGDLAGAVHYQDDAQVQPEIVLRSLRQAISDLGGVLRSGEEFREWIIENGIVVGAETSLGTIRAETFVIAGGTWSSSLTRPLGYEIALQPGKGYSFVIPPLDGKVQPKIGAILVEARVAVAPLVEGTRVTGTMELGAWGSDINEQRLEGIKESFHRLYPGIPRQALVQKVWQGHRPCTPDGLPLIGSLPEHQNVILATGHAMMGMSLGPVTGSLVRDIVTGQLSRLDITSLRPRRGN